MRGIAASLRHGLSWVEESACSKSRAAQVFVRAGTARAQARPLPLQSLQMGLLSVHMQASAFVIMPPQRTRGNACAGVAVEARWQFLTACGSMLPASKRPVIFG